MSEPSPTGYRESPDTTDGPVTKDQTENGTDPADVTLTTDEDAQRDDSIMRPGNEPD